MNQRLKFQLAGYIDDGMTYSNSLEVRSIVDASDVAREFYETLIFAKKRLEIRTREIKWHKKRTHGSPTIWWPRPTPVPATHPPCGRPN